MFLFILVINYLVTLLIFTHLEAWRARQLKRKLKLIPSMVVHPTQWLIEPSSNNYFSLLPGNLVDLINDNYLAQPALGIAIEWSPAVQVGRPISYLINRNREVNYRTTALAGFRFVTLDRKHNCYGCRIHNQKLTIIQHQLGWTTGRIVIDYDFTDHYDDLGWPVLSHDGRWLVCVIKSGHCGLIDLQNPFVLLAGQLYSGCRNGCTCGRPSRMDELLKPLVLDRTYVYQIVGYQDSWLTTRRDVEMSHNYQSLYYSIYNKVLFFTIDDSLKLSTQVQYPESIRNVYTDSLDKMYVTIAKGCMIEQRVNIGGRITGKFTSIIIMNNLTDLFIDVDGGIYCQTGGREWTRIEPLRAQ